MSEPIVLEEKLFNLLTNISQAKDDQVVRLLFREGNATAKEFRAFLVAEGIADDPDAQAMLKQLQALEAASLTGSTESRLVKPVTKRAISDVIKYQSGDSGPIPPQYSVTGFTKAALIAKLADDAGITKTQANAALDAFTAAVAKALKKNDRVTLVGFGTFSVSKRAARNGRNPQTGAVIKIKAKKVATFKAAKGLAAKL